MTQFQAAGVLVLGLIILAGLSYSTLPRWVKILAVLPMILSFYVVRMSPKRT